MMDYKQQLHHQQQQQYILQQQQQQQQQQSKYQSVPQQVLIATNQTNTDANMNAYLTLLGLADSFQQSSNYRLTIHCLESILLIKPQNMTTQANVHMQLKTRLSLCRLYLKHTVNTNQYVNSHLEKSMILVQKLPANDEYKYESCYIIYKIFQKQRDSQIELKQNAISNSAVLDSSQMVSLFNIDLMKHVLDTSPGYPIWHLRLLFLISDMLMHDREFTTAAFYMSIGIEYCSKNKISTYTHILFILCKGLVSFHFFCYLIQFLMNIPYCLS
jgi:hypothetical protein